MVRIVLIPIAPTDYFVNLARECLSDVAPFDDPSPSLIGSVESVEPIPGAAIVRKQASAPDPAQYLREVQGLGRAIRPVAQLVAAL